MGGQCTFNITAPHYQLLPSKSAPDNVTRLDVLLPDSVLTAAKDGLNASTTPSAFASVKSLLLVLPVEPGQGNRYGDGMQLIKELGYHNKQHAVVATPRFSTTPWFCDGDTNINRTAYAVKHEAYLHDVVVPLLQAQYCPGCPVDLIGFSKSGWGSLSLLLRNPKVYHKASIWDAPSMLSGDYCKYLTAKDTDLWDMMNQFGTCDAWRAYSPFELVPGAGAAFNDSNNPRIFLSGQHYFGNMGTPSSGCPGCPYNHTVQMQARMVEAGVAHVYNDALDPGKHAWSTFWLAPALDFLSSKGV